MSQQEEPCGAGGNNELRFGSEKLDVSLHHIRKDVWPAGSDAVPAGKYHKHSRKVNGKVRSTSLTYMADTG